MQCCFLSLAFVHIILWVKIAIWFFSLVSSYYNTVWPGAQGRFTEPLENVIKGGALFAIAVPVEMRCPRYNLPVVCCVACVVCWSGV